MRQVRLNGVKNTLHFHDAVFYPPDPVGDTVILLQDCFVHGLLIQGGWIIYLFISANQFQYPRTWYVISEKLYFTFMVWRKHSHWIEFGKFSSQFYGEYFWRFTQQWTFDINMIFLIDCRLTLNLILKLLLGY